MERQIEYKSEGNGNCLRLSCGKDMKNLYSCKMITENTIKGLLPCYTRIMDGETYFYYEIQSGQTLYCRYEEKEMDYAALENLFRNIFSLAKEMEKFLLDLKYVYFDERYIFQNIETGETGFLYVVDKSENEGNFAGFMEYIVTRINHTDTKAIQTAYRLYEIAKRQGIFLSEMEKLFEKKSEDIESRAEKSLFENNENAKKIQEEWRDEIDIEVAAQEPEDEKGKPKRIADIAVPCLFFVVLTIIICIKIYFSPDYAENALLLSAAAINTGIFLTYEIYRFKNRRSIKAKEEEKIFLERWDKESPAEKEGEYSRESIYKAYDETESFYKEEAYEKKKYNKAGRYNGTEGYDKVRNYEKPEKCNSGGSKIHNKRDPYYNEEMGLQSEVYGRTVFFEPEAENILCGLGKHERIIIKIEKFPFTIGKIAEETDYVLKDSSVSRLHARIYKEEKQVFLMDLNSTNGTCKNGFRLPPNEKVLLEEGDEISFGKIRFCYR